MVLDLLCIIEVHPELEELSCGIVIYWCTFVLRIGKYGSFNISVLIFLLILKFVDLFEEGDLYCCVESIFRKWAIQLLLLFEFDVGSVATGINDIYFLYIVLYRDGLRWTFGSLFVCIIILDDISKMSCDCIFKLLSLHTMVVLWELICVSKK